MLADTLDHAGISCQVGIELDQLDENGVTPPDAVLLDMALLEQSHARKLVEECHDLSLIHI